jgi:hypothetical protein
MERDSAALAAEIEAVAAALGDPGQLAQPSMLALFRTRLDEWRRAAYALPDDPLRERVIWALLGAERYLSSTVELAPRGLDPVAARLRLQAAARALRALLPAPEPPPSPPMA